MAKEVERMSTPEGRLIYEHLWERDGEFDPEKPKYRVTIGIPKGECDEIIEAVFNAACDEFGDDVQLDIDGGPIASPFKDGDVTSAKRIADGKDGGATAGMWLVTASTAFNAAGDKAAGGVQVYGPDVARIDAANRSEVYPGSYGIFGYTVSTYVQPKVKGVNLYLVAYQKTRDGERLGGGGAASMFKPVGRTAPAGDNVAPIGGARRRRGA
jgi:hypothetical protein